MNQPESVYFALLDVVALKRDLTDLSLQSGAVGTVVLVHGNGQALEVEFADNNGRTRVMAAIEASELSLVSRHLRVSS